MNKDGEVMKNMQKKYKFLGDKSKIYQYELDGENQTTAQILEQFKQLDRLKLKEYYPSEDEPYWRVSKKLVGSSFNDTVTYQQDQNDAVFYYSKHCHGCKKFGPIFEQIARLSMGSSSPILQDVFKNIRFSRMNNSLNAVEEAVHFGYTPVFTFFKKGYKNTPFVLRPQYMNFGILEDFLTVTRDVEIFDQDSIQKAFNEENLEVRRVRKIEF